MVRDGCEIREGAYLSPRKDLTPESQAVVENHAAKPVHSRSNGRRYLPPEMAIDLEADNSLLRPAVAPSVGAGGERELVSAEHKHRSGVWIHRS